MAEISLEMLQALVERVLAEQAAGRLEMGEVRREMRDFRREQGDMRSLCLALAEQGRRIERRVGELRDDLELMLKAELMGRLGNFETHMDARLTALETRLAPQ